MPACCCYWGRSLRVGERGWQSGATWPGGDGGDPSPVDGHRAGRRRPATRLQCLWTHIFLRCPFFRTDVGQANRVGVQPQLAPCQVCGTHPDQPPTAALGRAPLPGWGLTKRDKACHQPTPRGLTAEGLCRPPPEARRGALLPEQGVLPPLQGLLGLVTQLQVGLRDCGSTGVARSVPGLLGSVPRPPSRSSPRWAVQRKPGCAAGAPSPPHFGALSSPGGVPAGLSPHLSYAEESVLGGRWAGWEREAGSC